MVRDRDEAQRESLVKFGNELHRLRRLADMPQRELAKLTLVSHQMVGAIERAERYPRKGFAEKADKVLNAYGVLAQLWPGARQGYPHWFKEFVELEAEAKTIQNFQVQAVPGLFQTKGYARAVLSSGWPPSSEDEVERLLSARLGRQDLLARKEAPLLCVVLDEGVLRRPVGGCTVMAEQLDHLLALTQRSFIQLQVLPFATDVHAAMDGSFIGLDMGNGESLVYLEGPGSGQVITDADEVGRCGLRFGALRSAALSPAQSFDFIARYKEEHGHGIQPFQLA